MIAEGVGRSMSKHLLLPVVPSFLLHAMLPSLNGGGREGGFCFMSSPSLHFAPFRRHILLFSRCSHPVCYHLVILPV